MSKEVFYAPIRPQKMLSVFLSAVLFGLLFSTIAFGQGTRGTIRGTVSDPTGAVVPNATVRLIEATRGVEVRTAQTDAGGTYQFIEIEPSTYNIVVQAGNFAEARIVDITLEPNRNITIPVSLVVAQIADEVTVTAGAEIIDRESPTLGTTVERARVEGLPLDGRNVLNLALLQPGVLPAGGGFGGGLGIRVNASRGVENNLLLDGGNNNEVAVGSSLSGQPRPDAVQEFRLLTSNFEAEFGRNTGSVINVVTRSGTNDFRGNARFFYRPTSLSAARYLDNAFADPGEDARRVFDRKDYGFQVSGPVFLPRFGEGVPPFYSGRDRTFFMVDYERRWQKFGNTQTITGLPTGAERTGDFSGLDDDIIDPATGLPFPGNQIPAARISPIAEYYLQFIPQANGGATQVGADELTENSWLTTRLDHAFNVNHNLNFTFNYFDFRQEDPFAFGGSTIPGFGALDLRESQNYIGRYTWIINPNLVNYFLVNYSRNEQPSVAPVNTTTPAEIGFTANFVANSAFAGPPVISFFDRGFQLGNTIQGPQARLSENLQFQNSLSWVTGNHRMKFGFDTTRYKQGQDFLFINQGIFTYSGLFGGNTTGDDFADFLIGNSPIAIQFGAAGRRDFRQRAYAGFAQDTWNVTQNLTLSFGIRYEFTSPITDLFDRVAYYRPGATSQLLANGQLFTPEGQQIVVQGGNLPRGLVFPGDPDPVLGGTVPRGGVALDRNNWAPRVGFAYAFNPRAGLVHRVFGENVTVLRGGFGLYYGAIIGDTALQQLTAPGYSGTNAFFFPASGTLADPFAPDPFPAFNGDQGQISNPFEFDTATIPFPLNQMSQPIDPRLRTPEVYQWNLTLERGFLDDYVLGLSYVGNRGRKLYVREQVNPALGTFLPASLRTEPIPTPSITNPNSRRLNDDIRVGLTMLTTGGNSQYDSFQANLQKRLGNNGLLFQLAYTFSRSFNDSDTQRGQLDLLDRSRGWALSNEDVPHRFVGSFVYQLPFFRNTQGFANRLLDGWALNGIYTYQSGALISVGNPIDIDGTGGAILNFADLGTEPFRTLDPRTNDRLGFNPGAFAIANCGTNFQLCGGVGRRGTSGRNQVRLDNPINNLDLALIKKTRLWRDRSNLELRFEAFNVFNRAQFTTVNTNLNSADFGRFTDTRESRSVQLGARITF